jgi:hypothetical protein
MLVRKINRANWMNGNEVRETPSANALTNCLKTSTQKNTLSVWHINDETKLNEVVLAIVSGQDHLVAIDVVLLDDEYFVKCQISIEETEGKTPVTDLKNLHRDLCLLDYWTLGMVAYHVVDKIKVNKSIRFTETKLKKIIKDAIDKKRLELSDLKEDIQKKIT